MRQSFGTIVSARRALTNSRRETGRPLAPMRITAAPMRITAPLFCVGIPCQADLTRSNSGRALPSEAAIAIGS